MSPSLHTFFYNAEFEIGKLAEDIEEGCYKHGPYDSFIVCDNKKRTVHVASFRDRVLHRMLYDYLVAQYDKIFFYDVWSCREDKGLMVAITRAQAQMRRYKHGVVWRLDINKFFNSVDHEVLKLLLSRRVTSPVYQKLLYEVIDSYQYGKDGEYAHNSKHTNDRRIGIAIGNLTSQIFANIYLHEFDRYVVHTIRPCGWLRYGDDCIMIFKNKSEAATAQVSCILFLKENLHLSVSNKGNYVGDVASGIQFLGCVIYPTGRTLNKRMKRRMQSKLTAWNSSSYGAMMVHHDKKHLKQFNWHMSDILHDNDDI